MNLREAEVLLSQDQTIKQVCRSLEIGEQRTYRRQKLYGGVVTTQARKQDSPPHAYHPVEQAYEDGCKYRDVHPMEWKYQVILS